MTSFCVTRFWKSRIQIVINFQTGNKIEKLKFFIAEESLKILNILGQFLIRLFESRKQTDGIRRT